MHATTSSASERDISLRGRVLNVIRWSIGAGLLLAACLKMRPAATDIIFFGEALSYGEALSVLLTGLLLPLLEIVIAVFILRGFRGNRSQWLVASATFATFFVFALFAYLAGQTDCGCFGRLSVRPAQTLLLDGMALGFCLGGTILQSQGGSAVLYGLRSSLVWSMGIWLAIILGTGGLSLAESAIPTHSPIVARNHPARVSAPVSQWFQTSLVVRNVSKEEVRVFGASQSCGTRFDEPFPMVIKGGEIRSIPFSARMSRPAKEIKIPIWLYVGNETGHMQRVAYRATNGNYPMVGN